MVGRAVLLRVDGRRPARRGCWLTRFEVRDRRGVAGEGCVRARAGEIVGVARACRAGWPVRLLETPAGIRAAAGSNTKEAATR